MKLKMTDIRFVQTLLILNLFQFSLAFDFWPLNLNAQFSHQAPSPLEIISWEAMPILGVPPLSFQIPSSENLIVSNNGATVLVTLDQKDTEAIIFGGILGENRFRYNRTEIIWNNEFTNRCGTNLDRQGTAIEVQQACFNTKYLSFEEALKHKDGIVVLTVRVKVQGHIDNPDFLIFEHLLKQLIKPGTSVKAKGPSAFQWYLNIPQNYSSYYAYPGTYNDLYSKTRYESAIIIIFFGNAFPSISISQFEAFQALQGYDGFPLSNAQATFPKGKRPLIQSTPIRYVYPR